MGHLISGNHYLLVPKLAQAAQEQSDARSLMTGRITDAANIAASSNFLTATVNLPMKESMEGFMVTV